MSAESPGARERISRWRHSFRIWRWKRPFWAGLLTLLGGVPIIYIPYADPSLNQLSFRLATTTGSGSLIIGVLLFVLGVSLWFQPHSRVFSGVAAILLALVSLVVSNFGGFLLGFLLALIGGGMAVSWAPGDQRGPGADGPPDAAPGPEPTVGDDSDPAVSGPNRNSTERGAP